MLLTLIIHNLEGFSHSDNASIKMTPGVFNYDRRLDQSSDTKYLSLE